MCSLLVTAMMINVSTHCLMLPVNIRPYQNFIGFDVSYFHHKVIDVNNAINAILKPGSWKQSHSKIPGSSASTGEFSDPFPYCTSFIHGQGMKTHHEGIPSWHGSLLCLATALFAQRINTAKQQQACFVFPPCTTVVDGLSPNLPYFAGRYSKLLKGLYNVPLPHSQVSTPQLFTLSVKKIGTEAWE